MPYLRERVFQVNCCFCQDVLFSEAVRRHTGYMYWLVHDWKFPTGKRGDAETPHKTLTGSYANISIADPFVWLL